MDVLGLKDWDLSFIEFASSRSEVSLIGLAEVDIVFLFLLFFDFDRRELTDVDLLFETTPSLPEQDLLTFTAAGSRVVVVLPDLTESASPTLTAAVAPSLHSLDRTLVEDGILAILLEDVILLVTSGSIERTGFLVSFSSFEWSLSILDFFGFLVSVFVFASDFFVVVLASK